MKKAIFALMAVLSLSLAGAGCAADAEEEPIGDSEDAVGPAGQDESLTREGDEVISEESLRIGEENRAGMEEPEPVRPSVNGDADPVLSKYANVDPTNVVPQKLKEAALRYFDKNKARFPNAKYITVIDMSQHSKNKRWYLIDMTTGQVERQVVAHGKNSDPENDGTPRLFSNVSGSLKSSIGFYKTAETFAGNHGLSLRLDGLSTTNSNARARAIIVHGADYVVTGSSKQGRSWGCPAIPMNVYKPLIGKIKGGSLMYIDLAK
jgi:hypothetical protein